MPDDFRLFDKATSELLEICYKRYLTRFVADARSALREGYDIRQLTLYEFVKEGEFVRVIEEIGEEIYLFEHDL